MKQKTTRTDTEGDLTSRYLVRKGHEKVEPKLLRE